MITEPSLDSNMDEHENGNNEATEKKHHKKLKVASHTETLNATPTDTKSGSNFPSSSPSIPSRAGNNNITSEKDNGSPTHASSNTATNTEEEEEEDGLFHKKAGKKGNKGKKGADSPSWNTRLRTHPKPVVRFGAKKKKEKDKEDSNGDLEKNEEIAEDEEEDEDDLPHDEADIASLPPSSPHPSDDVPLETLLKHGSGWAFPREQNGKMICIFRSCPQPLRAGTRKDYIDHLRLHQTMQHSPLYSMLRHAPPGGILPPSPDSGIDDESQMSQVDGEWEGEDEDAEDVEEGTSGSGSGSATTKEGGTKEGGTNNGGEEELHTPKLSQRGLQLRAQMMKQDSEGRYLCFFMGCTMRMTTNFSRHIAKHEKKLDAISPDLVHLLKEGSIVEKPYVKDKKGKEALSLMMPSSSHLIPPPHSHSSLPPHPSHHPMDPMHRSDGIDIDPHHHPHSLPLSHPHSHPLHPHEMQREYGHRPPPPSSIHMQLQHIHLQHSLPVSHPHHPHSHPHSHPPLSHSQPLSHPLQQQQQQSQSPQFIHHPLSKMPHPSSSLSSSLPLHQPPQQAPPSYPPPRHPSLSHAPMENRAPNPSSLSPTNLSNEIRWVYRSPLPSPLSLPLPPRRPSLGPESDLSPVTHSPKKPFPFSSSSPRPPFPPSSSSASSSPSLPRLNDDLHDSHIYSSSSSLSSTDLPSAASSSISSSPSPSFSNDLKIPLQPPTTNPSSSSSSSLSSNKPPENQPDLGAVATSLLDLRKM